MSCRVTAADPVPTNHPQGPVPSDFPRRTKFADVWSTFPWMNREHAVRTGAHRPNRVPFGTATVLLTVAPLAMVTVVTVTAGIGGPPLLGPEKGGRLCQR